MKTRILISVVLASLFCAKTVTAFHGRDTLTCDKCHTVHYTEDAGTPPGGNKGGPFEHLFVEEHTSKLCLTCHDGKVDTPDVAGVDDVNGLKERAAGFFAPLDVDNPNGHNLTLAKTGGNTDLSKVGCIDCHDPHGRNTSDPEYRYRNLRWASDPGSEPIFKAFVNPDASGLEAYEQNNIGYTAPAAQESDWREVTNICFSCHHIFSSDGYTRNSSGICIRHPSTDSERGIRETIYGHGSPQKGLEHWKSGIGIGFAIDRVPFIVSGATNYTEATIVKRDNEVFCLTCHKAHGSNHNNSLRWSPNSNLGCQQCHNKG